MVVVEQYNEKAAPEWGGFGMPGGTRTPDLQLRKLSLYPTELQAHSAVPTIITAGQEGRQQPPHCGGEGGI